MSSNPDPALVFTDANILINLIHIDRLHLLRDLTNLEFVVPEPVAVEIRRPSQRKRFDQSRAEGAFKIELLTDIEELTLYATLRKMMGDGEAACLAMASSRGAYVATSDKKRKFLREAKRFLPAGRLMNLTDLLILAIQEDHLTIQEADQAKEFLETHHRFKLKFRSFADFLG